MSALELKRFSPLAELSESELELVADLLEERELAAGQPCFREGSEADGLVLVAEGTLALESRRKGDLGTAGAGAALGALSLVVVGPREATAIASEPTRVHLLTRTAFHRLLEDAPRTGVRVLERLLVELAGLVRAGLDRLA